MAFDPHSRSRLNPRDLPRFPGETLFDRVARTVCAADCLPRKELFEAWEVARRVRRRFRGGTVLDAPAGHGLLAWLLLLLDKRSPGAVSLDRRRPASAERLREALTARWPGVAARIRYEERDLAELEPGVDLDAETLLVSVHACGRLTDQVLALATRAGCRVAVLPCCQDVSDQDTGGLEGWLEGRLAVDVTRAQRLAAAGYAIRTVQIPAAITPQNRLLLGEPGQTEGKPTIPGPIP